MTVFDWMKLPEVEFTPGKHMIVYQDGHGHEVFVDDLDEFLARSLEELDAGRGPENRLPRIAEFHSATIDGDDIRGAIEESLPDEDHGGDPIHESEVCRAAAKAAQAVLDEAKMGAYWPTDLRPLIEQGWEERIRAKYALFPTAAPQRDTTEGANDA